MVDRTAAVSPIATSARASEVLWRRRWALGLVAALAAGVAFRLVWLHDVEYKADEAWAFNQVEAFWQTHAWRPVGIPSSAGLPHPGLNLWLFVGFSALLPAVSPLELTRAVELINVVALILLVVFALKAVDHAEREPWLWSVALVAVNPLAVLFSRKLWAQDLLPLFTLGLLVCWWYRGRRWGAFFWGLLGALLGQVHLSGFPFAAAFLGVILVFDRRSVRWPAWLAGSALGVIPLVPWLFEVARGVGDQVHAVEFVNPLIPFGHWVNFALGIDLYKSLGGDFLSFLASPRIGSYPSCLAGALFAVIVIVFVMMAARLVEQLRLDRHRSGALLLGGRSQTSLALTAAFFGYLPLLAAMSHPVFLHYMIVASPLPALWLARIAEAGRGEGAPSTSPRRLLTVLTLAQAGLTACFLAFIHKAQIIHGDYGTAFGAQLH